MDIKEVKDLIQDILRSDISEFELEHTGTRVKLRRGLMTVPAQAASLSAASLEFLPAIPNNAAVIDQSSASKAAASAVEDGLHLITSPIVGTFYRAPTPGAELYVRTGSIVNEGSVLCIVEAMKLMNEIPSDIAGEIVTIHVENGRPVEYGQKLFSIRPHK